MGRFSTIPTSSGQLLVQRIWSLARPVAAGVAVDTCDGDHDLPLVSGSDDRGLYEGTELPESSTAVTF